jgi:hypothetical protein
MSQGRASRIARQRMETAAGQIPPKCDPRSLPETYGARHSISYILNFTLYRKRKTYSSALDLFPGGPTLKEESVSGAGIQIRPPFKPECPKGINYCSVGRWER